MIKIEDFLTRYKNVDCVAGAENEEQLFKNIVYLIENEPQNAKTMGIIETVLYSYGVFKNYAHKNKEGKVYYTLEINLTKVPKKVAEIINEKTEELKISIGNYESMKRDY